jgi:hypothetical protein
MGPRVRGDDDGAVDFQTAKPFSSSLRAQAKQSSFSAAKTKSWIASSLSLLANSIKHSRGAMRPGYAKPAAQ